MAYSKLYLFLGVNLSVILYSQVLADIDVSPTLTVESNLPPMTDELNDKLILDLKAYFSLLDMDGDGSINNKELETLFLSFGQNPTDLTLQASTNRLDADINGTIDFPKFLNLMVRKRTYKELKEAFHLSDKDQNGFVSVFEFRYFMTNHGQKLTDEEVDEIFREADVDGDGQMNSEEFVKSYHDNVKGHGK